MRKSARMLGQEHGLTSQEMNYILKKEGYLEGDASDYSVTDKGAPFAEETDFHRGPGGYAYYNRDWTTRKWDESLTDDLDITEEMKEEAKEAVKERRKQKQAETKAARRKADEEFLARNNQMENDEETTNAGLIPWKVLGLVGLLAAGGYGIYKATPHVKKWWKNRQATKLSNSQKAVTKKVVYKYIRCPVCGDKAILNDKTSIFICNKCNYSITNKEIEDGTVFRHCD
jgi:ribosomal protein L37AE/L43A